MRFSVLYLQAAPLDVLLNPRLLRTRHILRQGYGLVKHETSCEAPRFTLDKCSEGAALVCVNESDGSEQAICVQHCRKYKTPLRVAGQDKGTMKWEKILYACRPCGRNIGVF